MQVPLARQIANIVDLLPEHEQMLVFEIVTRFLPDDVATPEDIAAHEEALEEYRRGETVRLEDVDRN